MPPSSLKRLVPCLVALLFLLPLFPTPASADRGAIPEGRLRYHEDAQNAIAAWNGREEVLMLTTDIGASDDGRLLEMLPLPSVPTKISLGNATQFGKFVDLFNAKVDALDARKAAKAGARSASITSHVEVIFHQGIGAHDITVAWINDPDIFAWWVRNLALKNGFNDYFVTEEMKAGVRDHLMRGISVFVFDILNVTPDVKSQDPVIYRFPTTRLYYPMAITAASYGNNGGRYPVVNLFLLVNGRIPPAGANFFALSRGRGFDETVGFSQDELGNVSPEISSLFRDGAQAAHLYSTGGFFEKDNWKKFQDVVIPRSRILWSDGSVRPQSVYLEGGKGAFLTGLVPAMLLCAVGFLVLFRERKQW
jgi:hypothetical protein